MALADIRSEIPRTFFHVLGGLFLAAVGYIPAHPLNLYSLAAIFGAALLLEGARLFVPSAKRLVRILIGPFMRPSEEDGLTGALPFTGGVFLAFLLFPRSVALASMVPLVFGDRAGLLFGKSIGRIPIGKKTFEGCMGCFSTTPEVFHYPLAVVLGASFIGTLAEALPRPFDDNLTIPIAVGVFLSLIT
jgi:dolichol kinase